MYGEDAFNGRAVRGAVELTPLDYQTLRNYTWIARRFPMPRRRETLSFSHHAEVAALPGPERDFWLRKAEEYGWPVKRLRRDLKASLRERCSGNVEESGQDQPSQGTVAALLEGTEETIMIGVPILAERLESCRAAVSRLGLHIETWAGQVLIRS